MQILPAMSSREAQLPRVETLRERLESELQKNSRRERGHQKLDRVLEGYHQGKAPSPEGVPARHRDERERRRPRASAQAHLTRPE